MTGILSAIISSASAILVALVSGAFLLLAVFIKLYAAHLQRSSQAKLVPQADLAIAATADPKPLTQEKPTLVAPPPRSPSPFIHREPLDTAPTAEERKRMIKTILDNPDFGIYVAQKTLFCEIHPRSEQIREQILQTASEKVYGPMVQVKLPAMAEVIPDPHPAAPSPLPPGLLPLAPPDIDIFAHPYEKTPIPPPDNALWQVRGAEILPMDKPQV